jgi:alpha 1,2-mannosyltransferase
MVRLSSWYKIKPFNRLSRSLRRYGLSSRRSSQIITLLLIYLTYIALSITLDSYQLNEPLWNVTRYRIRSAFGYGDDVNYGQIRGYFDKRDKNILGIEHKDVRTSLQYEHLKKIQMWPFNISVHFEELEEKVANRANETPLSYDLSFENFMLDYSELVTENAIEFKHPERVITTEGKPVIWDTLFIDDAYSRVTKEDLESIMEFDDVFLQEVKLKHQLLLSKLPREDAPYFENTSGYVLIGGSTYTWFSLLAIQSLRKVGSTLPIEMVIPKSSDVDKKLCEEVLPQLYNAKCITLEDIYPRRVLEKLDASGYQFKALAILASSFANTMYLDSDVFTVENPDKLFTSELYVKYGMITWPDFWRRSTSPKLYDILDIPVGTSPIRFINDYFTPPEVLYPAKKKNKDTEEERINFHDMKGTLPDWSTEAGIFLVNKRTHFTVLLLALYYNMNGSAGYYPLLSQGGAGEGDKETWPFAAHVLGKPWWQVNRQPDKTYGTWVKEVHWIIDSCIVQVDPLEDWEGILGLYWSQEIWRGKMRGNVYNYDYSFGKQAYDFASVMGATLENGGIGKITDNGEEAWTPLYDDADHDHYKVPMLSRPRDMFYHLHSPKLDPWDYVLDNLFTDVYDKQMRNFGDIWTRLGWDFELWVWENVRETMCLGVEESINGLDKKQLEILQSAVRELKCFSGRDYENVCFGNKNRLEKRIEWLRKEGTEKLKKDGKPPYGWKLAGKERERVAAKVIESWERCS